MRPWTQFFTLEGSDRRPKGRVSNILVENIDVECAQAAGHMQGNPADEVSNVVFRNVKASARKPFHNAYPQVVFDNVDINVTGGKAADNPDAEFEK